MADMTLSHRDELHTDLQGGNVLCTAPTISTLSEEQISLGKPEIGAVKRRDGKPLEPHIPRYLVRPATFKGSDRQVRMVDLGRGEFKIPQTRLLA